MTLAKPKEGCTLTIYTTNNVSDINTRVYLQNLYIANLYHEQHQDLGVPSPSKPPLTSATQGCAYSIYASMQPLISATLIPGCTLTIH